MDFLSIKAIFHCNDFDIRRIFFLIATQLLNFYDPFNQGDSFEILALFEDFAITFSFFRPHFLLEIRSRRSIFDVDFLFLIVQLSTHFYFRTSSFYFSSKDQDYILSRSDTLTKFKSRKISTTKSSTLSKDQTTPFNQKPQPKTKTPPKPSHHPLPLLTSITNFITNI